MAANLPEIVLFESEDMHLNLLPLAFTRPVAAFRVGITTIRRKWEELLSATYYYHPVEYLREKYGDMPRGVQVIAVASNILPDEEIVKAVASLQPGNALYADGELLAVNINSDDLDRFIAGSGSATDNLCIAKTEYPGDVRRIKYLFDIFLRNGEEINNDYCRRVAPLEDPQQWEADLRARFARDGVTLLGNPVRPDGRPAITIGDNARIEACSINVKDGPVYIGADTAVTEGSCVRGPLALCYGSKIRMGAKVYGKTTIGPLSKVGGELDNVVIFGYSNKAHDGYLGNAVVGEWCNIGAGVNASNLKNDYSKIRVWNYATRTFMRTDLQFCGLIMGDHSKAGINCMFNTATVVGVGVNVYGAGYPRVFIPSFSQGSPEGGFTDVSLAKFEKVAEIVMGRRNLSLNDDDRRILEHIYEVAGTLKR